MLNARRREESKIGMDTVLMFGCIDPGKFQNDFSKSDAKSYDIIFVFFLFCILCRFWVFYLWDLIFV